MGHDVSARSGLVARENLARASVAPANVIAVPTQDEIDEYFRKRIEEWISGEKGRRARQLAEKAGLTETHISTIRSRKRGVGREALPKLAKALGLTIEQVYREAGTSAPPASDRYPNRALAAQVARQSGISEEAVRLVESELLDAKTDPTPLYWLRKMELAAEELRHRSTPESEANDRARREADTRDAVELVKPRMPKKR